MKKIITLLSVCALIPAVSVSVAIAAQDDEDYVEYEEYEEESYVDDNLDSVRVVAKRMTCDDIKKEMDELNASSDLDETDTERLTSLKNDYRLKCSKNAKRRTIGRTKVTKKVSNNSNEINVEKVEVSVVQQPAPKKSKDIESTCDTPDSNGCCPGETYKDLGDLGFNCCTENDENCFPPMKPAKSSKMCEDGTAPDNDGCCADETYTDLGDLGFNCCQADGTTCFPPIK